jgi:hypothetical protein
MRSQATPAQTAANRANAQHSTGPKTETGKQASSQNSRKYGLTGVFVVLPEEDESEYTQLYESLRKDFKPADETEELLVRKMAQHQWQADRALYHQANSFYKEDFFAFERQVSLFMRYHTTHDRAFHKALNELKKLQKERRENQLQIPELKARKLANDQIVQASKVDLNRAKAQEIKAKTAKIGFVSQKRDAVEKSTQTEEPIAA